MEPDLEKASQAATMGSAELDTGIVRPKGGEI